MTTAKASASIVASAVVAIIGSLVTVLFVCLGFLGTLMQQHNISGVAARPQLPGAKAITMISLAFAFACGIFGIFSAVGLLRLRNWARISFLIYSGVMVFICAVSLAAVWFILPSLPTVQPQAITFVRVFVVTIYGLPMVVGVWWLILFNRKGIARQFQAQPIMMEDGVTPVPTKPACPLPLAVLAGFFLVSACFMPVLLLMPVSVPVVLFGHAINGRPALAIYFLFGATLAASAIGLLQLRKWSYPLAVGYHLFWCVNGTVTLLNPKSWTIISTLVAKMQSLDNRGTTFSYGHNQYLATSAGGLVVAIAILTMVSYYRNAFYEQSDRKRNLRMQGPSPSPFPPQSPQNITS